ncbi:MAG: peptidoglycan recognition family protein [Nanoarchaeota archaeon]|nr:peptidoglycan recognition family protein [Nanoarchaeota archaeon]
MELLKEVKFIAVHHSQRSIDSLKRIKNLHIKINGWEDIGYHYLIDKKGRLQKGRSKKFIGAHVFGHNKNSLGICLIGNFDKEKPTKKQIQTLIKFLKDKIKKHKIPIKNILGHREFWDATNILDNITTSQSSSREFLGVTKTCPGKFMDMDEIRKVLRHF